jgi:hypothetical protein
MCEEEEEEVSNRFFQLHLCFGTGRALRLCSIAAATTAAACARARSAAPLLT